MAIYANTNLVVDASKQWHLAQFANRAALPSGADGYMAYIQDQGDYVIKQGGAWHKFIRKPMDYKNETLIEQGTVANGYVNSSIYNTIHRIIHAQDILHLTTATTPFTSKYGGWHSTELYAYYHQGNNEGTTTQGTCKQSWSTYSVTTLATRSGVSGNVLNSLQPGPKIQNTFGILNQGTAGCYITFATDTWTSSGYGLPVATNYGWGTFGANYGYSWSYGYSRTYKLDWGTSAWSAAANSPTAGATANLGKVLNTKWEKFYHCGDSGTSQAGASKHDNASDTWATITSQINPQTEHSACMGQDWGYLLGGYGPAGAWAGQNAYSQKMRYATDVISRTGTRMDGANALSSGNACWGPL